LLYEVAVESSSTKITKKHHYNFKKPHHESPRFLDIDDEPELYTFVYPPPIFENMKQVQPLPVTPNQHQKVKFILINLSLLNT